MDTIENTRKFRINPNRTVELKLLLDSVTVYNISQEYPLGFSNGIVIPTSEELEIEIKVIRHISR